MRNKWRQRVFAPANGLEHINVTSKNFAKFSEVESRPDRAELKIQQSFGLNNAAGSDYEYV